MADPLVGSRAIVLMDFEASLGVLKGTTTPKKMAIVSETLDGTQKLIQNPSIRPDGNRPDPVSGNIAAQGQLTVISTLDAAPWFLKLFCHGITTTGASDPYSHTAKWNITSSTFHSSVIEIQFAASIYKKLLGCRIKKIGMKFMSEGFIQWTIDYIALSATYTTSTVLPGTVTDWTGSIPFHNLQLAAADCKLGGSAVTYISELEIEPNVNIQENDYRMGQSGARSGLAVGAMDLKAKLKLPIEGATQLTLLQSSSTTSVDITFTAETNHTMRIYLPRVTIQKTLPNVDTDMGLFRDVEVIGSYDNTATTQFQVVVANAVAAYA